MPTYQYACTSDDCGLRFERVQAFTDAAISECPECNSRVRKVYGSVGVVFKGSGFYRNDSRAASSANGAKSESDSGGSKVESGKAKDSGAESTKPAKGADAGSAGGSDAKPAAKSEGSKPAAAVGS